MSATARPFGEALPRAAEHADPREQLMFDPRPRGEMNDMVLESMHTTTWKYWSATVILAMLVATCFFYAWYYLIVEGLGATGDNRPVYWGLFLVNVVYWIGISHAGTFISAILRVLKIEARRPFTRAAELMTTFGLVQAGASVFMHMGRVWLAYWLLPFPNERGLWPDFHSPLMWDFLAINTYLLCSSMYLFLPLLPDIAMVRDRATGWRKIPYRILGLGFRGTEGEWKNLQTAMNIFAFAIIPVMFSVHTIVSWDFAMSQRPGWSSTVFGPYFVIGALQSGMAAVAIVLFLIRSTMKNMKYFLRPEHFNAIGKLMLLVSLTWAYFYFNDYLVPWYGGDKWWKILEDFVQHGPQAPLWYVMLLCNTAIPWSILWSRKLRSTPWLLAITGLIINVGMWLERFIIIPETLQVNRMPFTWQIYVPRIEIYMTIGTFAFFLLLYMLASRLIPLIPVWEVQEGQQAHMLRRIGKADLPTLTEIE